jgi:hypothetical protein
LCLLIGSAGYASSIQSNIKTLTKDAYTAFKPEDMKQFEEEHKCCGYDVIEEGSPNCHDKTPCGKIFVELVKKYPSMAITLSTVGAACLVSITIEVVMFLIVCV